MRQFERLLAGLGKSELAHIAGELLREIEGAEATERGYAGVFAEEITAGESRRYARKAEEPIHKNTGWVDVTIGPYEKAVGAEYVYDTHERFVDMERDIGSKGDFGAFAVRRTVTAGQGADTRAEAERLSEFFRRDSRRYDSGFTRY